MNIDEIVKGLESQDPRGWTYVDLLMTMFNQFRTTEEENR